MPRGSELQPLAAALLLVGAASTATALVWHHSSPVQAGAQTSLAVLAALATWRMTGREALAGSAGLGLAVWPLPAAVPVPFLAAALAPTALLLVPLPARAVEASVAAGTAFLVSVVTLRDPLLSFLALVIGATAALARPTLRTLGALRALRDTALFAPGPVLAGALFLNAVTGRAEHLPGRDAVLLGVALGGLLCLASAALLGLSVLLQSTHGHQRPVWAALSVVGGVFLASLPRTDPNLLLPLVVVAGGPLFVLASLAAARWGAVAPRFQYVAWSLPLLIGLAQIGLRA